MFSDDHQVPVEPIPDNDPVPDQDPTPDEEPIPDHNPITGNATPASAHATAR